MFDSLISQKEADQYLREAKFRANDTVYLYPEKGGVLHIPLITKNKDNLILDIRRGKIELKKNMFQTRVHDANVLARLDLGGPSHKNPDGEEIASPHLHQYREGYNDAWAFRLPSFFTDPDNIALSLNQFMDFCHIVKKPIIRGV